MDPAVQAAREAEQRQQLADLLEKYAPIREGGGNEGRGPGPADPRTMSPAERRALSGVLGVVSNLGIPGVSTAAQFAHRHRHAHLGHPVGLGRSAHSPGRIGQEHDHHRTK